MSSSIALALTTYWVWTFTGPYAWLVRAQMHTLHMYLIGVTAIVTFMVVAIPITTAARSIAAAAGLRADRVPFYVNLAYHRAPVLDFRLLCLLTGAAILILGTSGGGLLFLDAYLAGPLTAARAEDLAEGQRPLSRYIDVIGRRLDDDRHTVSLVPGYMETTPIYYFPVVPSQWRDGDAVHVVLQSHEKHPARLRGILRRVPGLVTTYLSRSVRVDDTAVLVDETAWPEDERRYGRLYVIVGTAVGLTLIAGATGAGWIARRRRRM